MPTKPKHSPVHDAATKLASIIYEDSKQNTPLLSPAAQKKKIAHDIEEHVHLAQKKIKEGIYTCIAAIHDKRLADEIGYALTHPFSKLTAEEMGKNLLNNVSWKEQLNIPETTMRHLYEAAKYHFDQDDMKRAESAFYFLSILDPKEFSFWIGLAHASTTLKHWEQAANAYAMASMLDPKNPWPHIWAGNAFLGHKNKDAAKIAFESAESLAGKDKNLSGLIQDKLAACRGR